MTGRIPTPIAIDDIAPITPSSTDIIAEPLIEKPKSGQRSTPPSSGGAESLGKVPTTATERKVIAPWQAEKHKKEGIKLRYQYIGYCGECGGDVETLELEDVLSDKQKIVAVCWCPTCHKKQEQRTVAKL
jgi:hypothetical protein